MAKLTASDGAAGDYLGYSVGVSSDGSTVVAGASAAAIGVNPNQGAAPLRYSMSVSGPWRITFEFSDISCITTSSASISRFG